MQVAAESTDNLWMPTKELYRQLQLQRRELKELQEEVEERTNRQESLEAAIAKRAVRKMKETALPHLSMRI